MKPCLIGCADFYYQQYPKIKYIPSTTDGDTGPLNASGWKLAETRKVCGRLRFDEDFSLLDGGHNNGYGGLRSISQGSSGPTQCCGDLYTCCGTGTWETDGGCLTSLAYRSYLKEMLKANTSGTGIIQANAKGQYTGANPNGLLNFLDASLLQTIIDRKFYYRFTFMPALRRDQPLTATIEFVYLPAHQTKSQWKSPDVDDVSSIDPGLVSVASITRQYIQSCDGSTVWSGTIQGWNIDPTDDGDSFENRTLDSSDELPYVGHMSLKLANPFDKASWSH